MKVAPPFHIHEDDPPAKRHILRAAMKLFSERGFATTSIRDIAKESGYTNPELYKHFASKEELALHLFETCHRRMWARCNAAVQWSVHLGDRPRPAPHALPVLPARRGQTATTRSTKRWAFRPVESLDQRDAVCESRRDLRRL
jgi:AcrR family transcriptional regulator